VDAPHDEVYSNATPPPRVRRSKKVAPVGPPSPTKQKSSSKMASSDGNSRTTSPSSQLKRSRKSRKSQLKVDTSSSPKARRDNGATTPNTVSSTPSSATPNGVRGSKDLRSPGMRQTPTVEQAPIPDFITQTDKYGNATTPRSQQGMQQARESAAEGGDMLNIDPCETLLDSIRLMCCCLVPEDNHAALAKSATPLTEASSGVTTAEPKPDENTVKLLPPIHPDDKGKKCLVLDLDETLVHSSFRSVPGADFVIPVQIEDVVHFVYVMKRPGVDEFLTEMAKHYEIVVYTASLNKYADPLLDLLDPNKVIRSRLFRESCVYYEGNYVKDLSLLDRDLKESIIVDNSPNSYIFHPENAIDCSSFIDDPNDRELDQIGAFLAGISKVKDVRHLSNKWREWPNVELPA